MPGDMANRAEGVGELIGPIEFALCAGGRKISIECAPGLLEELCQVIAKPLEIRQRQSPGLRLTKLLRCRRAAKLCVRREPGSGRGRGRGARGQQFHRLRQPRRLAFAGSGRVFCRERLLHARTCRNDKGQLMADRNRFSPSLMPQFRRNRLRPSR